MSQAAMSQGAQSQDQDESVSQPGGSQTQRGSIGVTPTLPMVPEVRLGENLVTDINMVLSTALGSSLMKSSFGTQQEARRVNNVIEDAREECKALQADNSLNTGSRPLFSHEAEARRIVKKLNRSQDWPTGSSAR